jgi:hypothetical protein
VWCPKKSCEVMQLVKKHASPCTAWNHDACWCELYHVISTIIELKRSTHAIQWKTLV